MAWHLAQLERSRYYREWTHCEYLNCAYCGNAIRRECDDAQTSLEAMPNVSWCCSAPWGLHGVVLYSRLFHRKPLAVIFFLTQHAAFAMPSLSPLSRDRCGGSFLVVARTKYHRRWPSWLSCARLAWLPDKAFKHSQALDRHFGALVLLRFRCIVWYTSGPATGRPGLGSLWRTSSNLSNEGTVRRPVWFRCRCIGTSIIAFKQ